MKTQFKEQRSEVQLLLKDLSSLKAYLVEIFEAAWRYAIEQVKDDYPNVLLPARCPFPYEIDPLLMQKFWLAAEHRPKAEG